MNYLIEFGFTQEEVNGLVASISDETYSDLTFFKQMVSDNILYLKDFGVTNYSKVFVKYPEIFLRDNDSFKNVLSKFDKEDLIQKVLANVAVLKKMVEYVDNN